MCAGMVVWCVLTDEDLCLAPAIPKPSRPVDQLAGATGSSFSCVVTPSICASVIAFAQLNPHSSKSRLEMNEHNGLAVIDFRLRLHNLPSPTRTIIVKVHRVDTVEVDHGAILPIAMQIYYGDRHTRNVVMGLTARCTSVRTSVAADVGVREHQPKLASSVLWWCVHLLSGAAPAVHVE